MLFPLHNNPEALAKQFHEIYEGLATGFGYETRKASAVPWEQVPNKNKRLMIKVCEVIQIMLVNERDRRDSYLWEYWKVNDEYDAQRANEIFTAVGKLISEWQRK